MLYKNILLIDDDSDDTDVFVEAITTLDKDITCLVENNPIRALEFLEETEKKPDLIFLDYNMPVLNGNEFIEKMRVIEDLQSIPVIIYSSYSESAAEQLSIIHSSERYITKPHNFDELIAVLKDILKQ